MTRPRLALLALLGMLAVALPFGCDQQDPTDPKPSRPSPPATVPTQSASRVPDWAEVLEYEVDPAIVVSEPLRSAIAATGMPWRVRHRDSGIEMLLIPPGEFLMGRDTGKSGLRRPVPQDPADPRHEVSISRAFYLGRYEVTQEQWVRVIGRNPSRNAPMDSKERVRQLRARAMENGMTRSEAEESALRDEREERAQHERSQPVSGLSWDECTEYCGRMSLRLPTEAEWEYAYRAGTETDYHGFPGYLGGTNDGDLLENIAWFGRLEGTRATKRDGYGSVGQKEANGFGLHDMSGSVWEWISDWYGEDYYSQSPRRDPRGPKQGSQRVLRGGDRSSGRSSCTAWARRGENPNRTHSGDLFGLRVARDP